MNTQNEVTLSFVESFESYAADSKSMGELKARLEDARKVLEPVIRAHRIPIEPKAENVKAWKAKREIFLPLVQELEWPALDEDDVQDEKLKALKKKADARIVAWLGVIKTCLELQILPTDKNADRLRKARVWTGLNGNGKVNPNWVDPKAKKPEPEPDAANDEEAEMQTDALIAKIEAQIKKEDSKELNAIGNALALAAMEPVKKEDSKELNAIGNALALAAMEPVKKEDSKELNAIGNAPQKGSEAIHPLTSNISGGSETPISPREHCGILLDQLFKNDAFRGEFAPILAMCLDSNVATVTRCLVEARDAMLNGKGGEA